METNQGALVSSPRLGVIVLNECCTQRIALSYDEERPTVVAEVSRRATDRL